MVAQIDLKDYVSDKTSPSVRVCGGRICWVSEVLVLFISVAY